MSTPSPTPTTTYPFRVSTYTNASPSPPSSYPTTYTETTWRQPTSAATKCASATQYPQLEGPVGLEAGCVISNAEEVNKNAFWDMYACCPGHGIESYGYSYSGDEKSDAGMCMVQCRIKDEESPQRSFDNKPTRNIAGRMNILGTQSVITVIIWIMLYDVKHQRRSTTIPSIPVTA